MKRERIDHDTATNRPLDSHAVLWIVGAVLAHKIALVLRKRRNMRPWATFIRPHLCRGSITNHQRLLPVRRFWPIIQRAVRSVDFVFPRYVESNINRIVKCVFGKAGLLGADRFASKCFRSACPNSMEDSDATLGQIMKAVGRNAAWRRLYFYYKKMKGYTESLICYRDMPQSDEDIGEVEEQGDYATISDGGLEIPNNSATLGII